jgi:hypothetical protein
MFGHLAGLFSGMLIPFLLLHMHYAKIIQKKQFQSNYDVFTEKSPKYQSELI